MRISLSGLPRGPALTPYPAWNDPAQAIARREFTAAADLLAHTDMVTEEASAGRGAGEPLAAQGRHAEARPRLDRATAFYRAVGGSAYAGAVTARRGIWSDERKCPGIHLGGTEPSV